jgi:DNA polymerase
VSSPDERREGLKALFHEARGCVRCPELVQTRHTVVFGAGHANADLMFVGEAPGRNEDEQGLPFVGQAGRLLDTLLAEIGLSRDAVFVTNVLRCRPPGNRDPHPVEIERCQDYLFRTIELVQPTVICTLGNFATKLLRHDTTGIMRLHGQAEVRTVGPRTVRLFPVFHPAAALYTPANVEVLRQDFQRLPELLALGPPPAHGPGGDERAGDRPGGDSREGQRDRPGHLREVDGVPEPEPAAADADDEPQPLQLGLF